MPAPVPVPAGRRNIRQESQRAGKGVSVPGCAGGPVNGKVMVRFPSFLSEMQRLESSGRCFPICIAMAANER